MIPLLAAGTHESGIPAGLLRRLGRRDERGVAASALLVTGVLVALGIVVYMGLPLVTAIDAKAQNRTAADAAALAGAEGVRDDLLDAIASDGVPGAWTDLADTAGFGRARAEEYAALNDAQLTEYSFFAADGTAHATVLGEGAEGRPARSAAVAQVDLPDCDPLELPQPPSADPSAPPVEQPPEPPEVDVPLSCDGFDLTFRVRLTEAGPQVLLPPGQLAVVREAMDVRLID